MYADVGYSNGKEYIFEEKNLPLAVSSCGHYRMHKFDHASTHRPNGLADYQLLYFASGKGHFYFTENEETLVTAGQMVLYRPHEMQKYIYQESDLTDVYWVHFTGNQVEQLLQEYHFPTDSHVLYCGISSEYQRIYQAMIQELQLQHTHFKESLVLLLQQLYVAVSRQLTSDLKDRSIQPEMASAANYFREHYNEEISIEKFAADRNMSISWFIRSFRQYNGKTPLAYILNIRISTARHLLQTTSYNVTEIASIVGYDNPLYFCRLFKKMTGFAPSEYRNQAF